VPALAIPPNSLKVTGEVKYYENRADSGNTFSRGFCPDCGGRVFAKTSGFPQFVLVTAGSLDDPSRFKPGRGFFHVQRATLGSHGSQLTEVREQPKV